MGFILWNNKFEFGGYDDYWLIDLIFLISLHSLQDTVHSIEQQAWVWKVLCLIIDWFDLPQLTTLTAGDDSFSRARSLCMESDLILNWLILSSSTHLIHYRIWSILFDMIDWFDLPNLTTFYTKAYSFEKTMSLSLSSLMIYDDLMIWSSTACSVFYRNFLFLWCK